MWQRVFLTWFLFIPIAILNGVIRETTYQNWITEIRAHQLSTILAAIAFFCFSYYMLKKELNTLTSQTLVTIGFLWVSMTICFEFIFGHYVDGQSWEKLWSDYNLFEGNWWGLFLIWMFLCPHIIKWLKLPWAKYENNLVND